MKSSAANDLPADLLDIVIRSKIIYFLGPKDSGKSTAINAIARSLQERHDRIGVLSLDSGKPSFGSCLEYGLASVGSDRLLDRPPASFVFVGDFTPKGHVSECSFAEAELLKQAWYGQAEVLLIDSSGWVLDREAKLVKRVEIGIADPDLVIIAEKDNESLENLRTELDLHSRKVVTVRFSGVRKKPLRVRLSNHVSSLALYFEGSHEFPLEISHKCILDFRARRNHRARQREIQSVLETVKVWSKQQGSERCVGLASALRLRLFERRVPFSEILEALRRNGSHFVGLLDNRNVYCGMGILSLKRGNTVFLQTNLTSTSDITTLQFGRTCEDIGTKSGLFL